jgi:hypothetical protein
LISLKYAQKLANLVTKKSIAKHRVLKTFALARFEPTILMVEWMNTAYTTAPPGHFNENIFPPLRLFFFAPSADVKEYSHESQRASKSLFKHNFRPRIHETDECFVEPKLNFKLNEEVIKV